MYNIMVIDDEPRIVEILTNFLIMKGYAVTSAFNGKEALNFLKKNKAVDLILLDEKMPVMSGATFLIKLREKEFEIPVIVLTGSLNFEQINSLDKSLFQHILIKPIRLIDVLRIIEKYLPRKKKITKKRKP